VYNNAHHSNKITEKTNPSVAYPPPKHEGMRLYLYQVDLELADTEIAGTSPLSADSDISVHTVGCYAVCSVSNQAVDF
jgi:hypothetical protein